MDVREYIDDSIFHRSTLFYTKRIIGRIKKPYWNLPAGTWISVSIGLDTDTHYSILIDYIYKKDINKIKARNIWDSPVVKNRKSKILIINKIVYDEI